MYLTTDDNNAHPVRKNIQRPAKPLCSASGSLLTPLKMGDCPIDDEDTEFFKRAVSKTPSQMTIPPIQSRFLVDELPTKFKNQPRLLVSCDWLTLRALDTVQNFEFDESGVCFHENYRFEALGYGSKTHRELCKVYFGKEDTPFCEILFSARLDPLRDSMFIKYENRVFYGSVTDLALNSAYLPGFLASLGSQVLGITRCDIAADGVDFGRFLNLYCASDCYEKIKSQNLRPTDFRFDSRTFAGFSVGSRKGQKYAVYYDKLTEINEKSKKQYILDFWQANNFDLSNGVNRFELRMNSEAFADMDGFEFDPATFFNPANMVRILRFQLKHFFEFVPSAEFSGDSVRSRRPRVELFEFSDDVQNYCRAVKNAPTDLQTAKIMAKRLLRDGFTAQNAPVAFTNFLAFSDTVSKYCLEGWLLNKKEQIAKDIIKFSRIKAKPFLDGMIPNPSDVVYLSNMRTRLDRIAETGEKVEFLPELITNKVSCQKNLNSSLPPVSQRAGSVNRSGLPRQHFGVGSSATFKNSLNVGSHIPTI